MAKQLVCPKCKGNNLQIQFMEEGSKSKTKHTCVGLGGHAHNAARGILAISTLGVSNLVVKKAKGESKTKSKTKNVKICICQDCGNSWKIK